ncbi:MAG: UDP-2,3-diacylglucosamine diphosphatase [Calditrichaceae bacterium]|jgi:UDP-2,3-diacylglucosamine pyrophosphatase LpxH
MKRKRKIDILVLSDIHLGTYGCKADQLHQYLKSISPKRIILNGDIIDMWQFKKRYWPNSHTKVLKHLFKWMSKGIPVDYITGNHDEALRRYAGFKLGSFNLVNKKVLRLNGKKAWIFHGDVFDVTMKFSPWLAKLGAVGYDLLILTNNFINRFSMLFGKERISLSKKVKDNVKHAVKYIGRFEDTAIEIAAKNNYDFVICGHIHKPEIRKFYTRNGDVTYLNSGDWIENLSALEYANGEWSIYTYDKIDFLEENIITEDEKDISEKSLKELFGSLVDDILNNN